MGGGLAFVLVAFNGTVPTWEGLVILAVMFLGTTVYRAETGQIPWWHAACAAAVVTACAVGSSYAYGDGSHFTRRGWIVSFLLSLLTFGAGLAWRHRHIPRWLTGLGTISYSVYLVHPVLLAVSDGTIGRWERDNPALEVAFYVLLLPLCVLTYRYIAAPGQARGRHLARRVRPRDEGPRQTSTSTPPERLLETP